MTEPEVPQLEEILDLHEEALSSYGGVAGVKDLNSLESALARPLNRLYYSEPGELDLFDLAATYAAGIAANHAFNDGNKRTAWAACVLFLKLNGIQTRITPELAAEQMVALATHATDDAAFAAWLRAHQRPA